MTITSPNEERFDDDSQAFIYKRQSLTSPILSDLKNVLGGVGQEAKHLFLFKIEDIFGR